MSIVTITLNNKNYQLSCENGQEKSLLDLAEKLNQRIDGIKLSNNYASYELILVMTALSMQDHIENLEKKIAKTSDYSSGDEEEKFAQSLTEIAGYLENLAKKIGK